MRVIIPLGKNLRTGIILAKSQTSDLPENTTLKSIIWPLESVPLLDQDTFAMICDLSVRSGVESGKILGHIIPKGLRETAKKIKILSTGEKINIEDIDIFKDKNSLAIDFMEERAVIFNMENSEDKLYTINIQKPWPLRPAAKKQIAILDFLDEHGPSDYSSIKKNAGSNLQGSLEKLLKAGIIKIIFKEEKEKLLPPPPLSFKLNEMQQNVVNDLYEALNSGLQQTRMLYGVTGSGKTAIYNEVVKYCLENNKNVLLLAPEIGLASKLYRDFKLLLPNANIIIYHGSQNPNTRKKIWTSIGKNPNALLVIGTRSALFLPIKNLQAIILDEEHDNSFKQDDIFPYHAKELAWFRMAKSKGLLLLGSATPDIKTFFASETNCIKRLDLPKRVSGNALPPIELVDISKYTGIAQNFKQQGLLSENAQTALKTCLAAGEQAVILLNRRGYSPLLHCINCSKIITCPNCAIGLNYHKSMRKLVCHYCGFSINYPCACPDCKKFNFLAVGEGTEKIAEFLETIAGREVLRLDRDNAKNPEKINEILELFKDGHSPFLIGTQMLSKGHHFPNVTLVIIADGDIGLNLPDYRAAEKTFQLLVQAAGRAGRGEKQGKVIIQTRNINHYCWHYICKYDYMGFYMTELERRKKHNYPPFTKLGLLRINFPHNEASALESVKILGKKLGKACANTGATLLGPAPAPIPLINGKQRFQCLIKAHSWDVLRTVYFTAKNSEFSAKMHLFFDLDPVNML